MQIAAVSSGQYMTAIQSTSLSSKHTVSWLPSYEPDLHALTKAKASSKAVFGQTKDFKFESTALDAFTRRDRSDLIAERQDSRTTAMGLSVMSAVVGVAVMLSGSLLKL